MTDEEPTVPDPKTSTPTLAEPAVGGGKRVGHAPSRYVIGDVLGRGGMGEIVSARDEQIGRSVAIKRIHADEPSAALLARFVREARIQGRLEHPAIVPVHEIGVDHDGRPFFVMKQLAGMTLAHVLERAAAGDREVLATMSRNRLLRAFGDICLAIEFAHTRGVIHRDLKPSNVMLGDFGEVYVLDWGIARVMADSDDASITDETIQQGPHTVAGAVLGTLAYMAPEQARGDANLDHRADVYALGRILEEILAISPEVPPELAAILKRATALDREDRFVSARQLGETVQRFLDGDRDLELRKTLASRELDVAIAANEQRSDPEQRRRALAAAARALALDPTAPEPANLVGRLMIEAPAEVPAEVEAELAHLDLVTLHTSARFGIYAAIAYLLFLPILYWIGFRQPWLFLSMPCVVAAICYVEIVISRRNPIHSGYLAIALHLVLLAVFSSVVSPCVISAGPGIIMVMLMASHPGVVRTFRLAMLAALATLWPFALQLAGVIEPPLGVAGSSVTMHTLADHLNRTPLVFGIVTYLVLVLAIAALVSRSQDDERRANRRMLQIQAWQLRQLLPSPAPV